MSESNRFRKAPIASTYGNAAMQPCSYTFASTAAGEVVDMFELPPGAELCGVDLVQDALGASTTIAVGYRYKVSTDGTDAPAGIRAAASSSSAGSASVPIHPLVFDVPVIITITLAGATATGKFTLTPRYHYVGTK